MTISGGCGSGVRAGHLINSRKVGRLNPALSHVPLYDCLVVGGAIVATPVV